MKKILILVCSLIFILGCSESLNSKIKRKFCEPIRTDSYRSTAINLNIRGLFTDITYKCKDGQFPMKTIRGHVQLKDLINRR